MNSGLTKTHETRLNIPETLSLKGASLDLTKVYEAERRIPEIQIVNKETSAGIMAQFMEGYGQASHSHALLTKMLTEAENAAKRRRAIVILDIVPDVLKERGLVTARNPTGSEDLRNAVLETDEDYQKIVDRIAMLQALRALVAGKMKTLEMSYNAVKKVISPDNSFFRPDTSVEIYGNREPFGKARI